NGAHGSRASGTTVPTPAAESSLYRLELQSRSHARTLNSFSGDLAVAKESLAERHTTHLQALELQRRKALADDELGAASADVGDEPLTGFAGHGVCHAGVDEARLFHSSDDFNGVTQRFEGALEKRLLAVGQSQSIRPNNAN